MDLYARHEDSAFRTPSELAVTALLPRRFLIVGSCLVTQFAETIRDLSNGCAGDHVLFNNLGNLPSSPPVPIGEYDLQFIQVPVRSVMPESMYYRLPSDDLAAYDKLFQMAEQRLCRLLDGALRWNVEHGLLTLVFNFQVPQQNPMGRLLPRYDLRNMVYFFERLNENLTRHLERYRNVFVLDFDQIVATFGRKFFQDDILTTFNHSSVLGGWDFQYDQARLQPPRRACCVPQSKITEMYTACWNEAVAMFRTVRQADAIKLVIVDLDDTLWRGVLAEGSQITLTTSEGWPIGLVEALLYLKRRGILLAIASKNEEARVRELWEQIYRGRLELEDFAAAKINWAPKVDNIEAILRQVNVLPRNTLFIDDNPVERAAVKAAFPEIRTLGEDIYDLRRVLLWSAETQVPVLTAESARRTEMVQAQAAREEARTRLSREEFLQTLNVQTTLAEVRQPTDTRFPRAQELINKTNQFNTTGRRWTAEEFQAFFQSGGVIYTFEVTDRFTSYGLVGAVITSGAVIEQFVMSCRVLGLDVELSVMEDVIKRLEKAGAPTVRGLFSTTAANFPCRDLFARCGFEDRDGEWVRPTGRPSVMVGS
jgi:FkbH-like protein